MTLDISAHSEQAATPMLSGPAPRAELVVQDPVIHPAVSTLEELHAALRAIEARENPDVTASLSELRVTAHGTLLVPNLPGEFALTDWSRRQLEHKLGVRWSRWFARVSPEEGAAEINTRLSRSPGRLKLRTTRPGDVGCGVLRAFVSESYSPFPDSALAELLSEVLSAARFEVRRVTITSRSVSYVISTGDVFRPGGDAKVGDVQGGIIVRNSGVGFASLLVTSHLERLICTNGMVVPVEDPVLIACVHRGVSVDKVRTRLAERARAIGGVLKQGAERLLLSRRHRIEDRERVFEELLKRARLPKKLVPSLEAAYLCEPEETVFGVVQAATRAAQKLAPEERFDLERAASGYLAELALPS